MAAVGLFARLKTYAAPGTPLAPKESLFVSLRQHFTASAQPLAQVSECGTCTPPQTR
jgi:hypothetical protein